VNLSKEAQIHILNSSSPLCLSQRAGEKYSSVSLRNSSEVLASKSPALDMSYRIFRKNPDKWKLFFSQIKIPDANHVMLCSPNVMFRTRKQDHSTWVLG
jgi:hypothetical protein